MISKDCIYGAYCVDPKSTDADFRYGMWVTADSDQHPWLYIPFEDFPKKVRLTLLLLGIH